MLLRLLQISLFIISALCAFGQKNNSTSRGGECFVITQFDENYIIRLGDVDYNDNDKVYLCEDDLPLDIEILNKTTGEPVEGQNWGWTLCNCGNPNATSYSNELTSGSFEASKTIISEVIFEDISNAPSTEIIHLSLDIELRDKLEYDLDATLSIGNYAFDTHPHSPYPFDNKDVPSKLLVHTSSDVVVTKSHKSYLKNAVLTVEQDDIMDAGITDQKIEMKSTGINPIDKASVFICNDDILFDVDIYPLITEDIYLYRLAESDDDYANYCVNANGNETPYEEGDVNPYLLADCTTSIASLPNPETFECINPGDDGSLDLFFETNKGYWKFRMDNDETGNPDVLNFNPNLLSTLKIFPGKDANGEYRCNSRPVIKPSEWDTDRDGKLDSKVIKNVLEDIKLEEIKQNLNKI